MSHHVPALLPPLDTGERLGPDDMATRREAEFLADALAVQQLRARGGELIVAGTCTNCGERCAPAAVYCDTECRADHERRLAAHVRMGKPPGQGTWPKT